MNAKERDKLAMYVVDLENVADTEANNIARRILSNFPSIRDDYEAYKGVDDESRAIDERVLNILEEKFGSRFAIKRACNIEQWKIAREQAETELNNYDE